METGSIRLVVASPEELSKTKSGNPNHDGKGRFSKASGGSGNGIQGILDRISSLPSPSDFGDDPAAAEQALNELGGLIDAQINAELLTDPANKAQVPVQGRDRDQANDEIMTATDNLIFIHNQLDDLAKKKGFASWQATATHPDARNQIIAQNTGLTDDLSRWDKVQRAAQIRLSGGPQYAKLYADKARQVLGKLRPYGTGDLKSTGDPRLQTSIRDAGKLYPNDWVNASNKNKLLVQLSDRGLYNNSKKTLTTTGNADNAAHEMAHRMEDTLPNIKQITSAFYDRRTKGETPQSMQRLSPGGNWAPGEVARPDKFPDPYMGKAYKSSKENEILSMGVQRLFYSGSSPHLSQVDPDYNRMILGLLAKG